jgi:hypothetical protein
MGIRQPIFSARSRLATWAALSALSLATAACSTHTKATPLIATVAQTIMTARPPVWSLRLAPAEWASVPATLCSGTAPLYEVRSARPRGPRLSPRRLFRGTWPRQILGSSYRTEVRVLAHCDPTRQRPHWPMLRVLSGETRP